MVCSSHHRSYQQRVRSATNELIFAGITGGNDSFVTNPNGIFGEGLVELESLAVSAPLGVQVQMLIESPILSLTQSSTTVSIQVSSECSPGQHFVPAFLACQECELGEFESSGECFPCKTGMGCDGPGTALSDIPVTKGYWRADASSVEVYECPLSSGCMAGSLVSDAACDEGYVGVTCGTCQFPEFYLESASKKCKKCKSSSLATLVVVGVTLTTLAVCGAACASYWASVHRVKMRASVTLRALSMARLKIVWVTLQIICSATATLGVTFPEPFRGLLSFLDYFLLDFGLLPLACVEKFSFYEELLAKVCTRLTVVMVVA